MGMDLEAGSISEGLEPVAGWVLSQPNLCAREREEKYSKEREERMAEAAAYKIAHALSASESLLAAAAAFPTIRLYLLTLDTMSFGGDSKKPVGIGTTSLTLRSVAHCS